jgi:hypothetical protein
MSVVLDASLKCFEKTLNVFGYIPIISTISGSIRAVYGKVELISGLGIAAISSLSCSYNRNVDHGLELAVHGLANICRAAVEIIPFVNWLCIPYDLANRFEYQSLQQCHHIHHIYIH